MEEILELLKSNPSEAVNKLTDKSIKQYKIKALRDEFHDIYRNNRRTQIGFIQRDKIIGKGENAKVVQGVKVPIPFQNKIVRTATAFEVGEAPTIIPNILDDKEKENRLTKEISRLWKTNRISETIQNSVELRKSELQCAVLFYIKTIDKETIFNKLIGLNPKKEIKTTLLKNENGKMTPVFDDFGDMKAFVWEFETKKNSTTTRNVWVYTDTDVYVINNKNKVFELEEVKKHGFNKIPIAYTSQENPEWFISQDMIDRLEVAMSKLAAANDYSGHPILKLYGEVLGAPDKDEDGKALRMSMNENKDTGKVWHGDAQFLTRDNAPESVKLELDRLEKYIYSLTSTPDLSLENLKGIGDISGKAIRLMFMDAIIKSKMNEGQNRTFIERMINIFISGIVTTTAIGLKSEARKTFFDVKFNSILPSEINEDIQTYVQAVKGKIMSHRTAIKETGMAEDIDMELNLIKQETEEFLDLEREEPANENNL